MKKKKKTKIRTKIHKGLKTLHKKSPVGSWFRKEEEHTRKTAHGPLSKDDIRSITILAVASVVLAVFAKIMIFMRWSSFPSNSYFVTWHPYAPIFAIMGSLLYIYCLKAKRIDFWLAYFPAVFGIVYCIIEMGMIHCWFHPSILRDLFGPFADDLPEILTGPKV